jgi:hypothetical protein
LVQLATTEVGARVPRVAGDQATAAASWLGPRELCEATSRFLDEVWSEEHTLYPFTTSVVDRRYVSDYQLPWAVRYTINTLLGRLRATRAGVSGAPSAERLERELASLRERYGPTLGAGDRGLLLVLMAEFGVGADELQQELRAARASLGSDGSARLNLQDLSWLLWGALRALEAGVDNGLVAELRTTLRRLEGPALARHRRSRVRGDLVSFGSTVYYLRVLHEHARVLGDRESRARFEHGVRTALGFQGQHGEWPWLLSVSRGHALDVYPVYTVHQLAMAMLFLLPALDDGAVEGVGEAICRSYRWVLGENEIGALFAQEDPFIVYRSLERREPLPKLTRFARATGRNRFGRPSPSEPARRTRVNREWRSYEGGWLLYTWSGRSLER